MTDIVERLRQEGEWTSDKVWESNPVCEEAADEIDQLREALRDCHHVLHKLMGIVPGNDTAVHEMAEAMKKARAALGEGK